LVSGAGAVSMFLGILFYLVLWVLSVTSACYSF
jgi:hypothetical protein